MIDSQGLRKQHMENTLGIRFGGENVQDRGDPCAIHVVVEHENLSSLESRELYTQQWYADAPARELLSPSLPVITEAPFTFEDYLWDDLMLSQSQGHAVSNQEECGIQHERCPLVQKNSESFSYGKLSLVEEMVAQVQRSQARLSDVYSASPEYDVSARSKSSSVHWPQDTDHEVETECKRLKSGSSSELTGCSQMHMGPIPNTSSDGNLSVPLKLINTEGSNIVASELLSPDVLESSNLASSQGQRFVMSTEGKCLSTSSPDTASSDAHILCPNSRSTESVSKVSFEMAKSHMGNHLRSPETERDQNVSPNVLKVRPASGTAHRISVPSFPLPRSTTGVPGRSRNARLMERNVGGRVSALGGAQTDSSSSGKESRWAIQLLLDCAASISSKNFVRTQHLMWVLNDLSNLTGDANQRLAAYGLKALFYKVSGKGEAAAKNPLTGQLNGGPKLVHRALLKFLDVSPWHQMVYTVANSVMLETFEGEDKVHVIDIGVSQGTQWPTFIEALASRASGPPSLLRLTVVKDEEDLAPFYPGGHSCSSTDFMIRLARFAKLMGIDVTLSTVVSSLEVLTREKLGIIEGEALAICTQFRLHRLSETAARKAEDLRGSSPRDSFLQFLHSLKPKVLVLSENDADHLAADFLTRFRQVVDYFWKFLDSTSLSFHGKHCEERHIIESEASMTLMNNVLCEGENRSERNESHVGWTGRMKNSGFLPVQPKEEIVDNIKGLIRKYEGNWEYATDADCVILLWKQQPVTFCSVWKPASSVHNAV